MNESKSHDALDTYLLPAVVANSQGSLDYRSQLVPNLVNAIAASCTTVRTVAAFAITLCFPFLSFLFTK